jgi:UDP-N-acetylglucosamine 2-epimerase (non-hydrolysing)
MRGKILVVLGTRPEAIKLAPVIRALRASRSLVPRVCVTGQHREMLEPMLDGFAIRPAHNLAVMEPGQDLFDLTARLLPRLRDVLIAERPVAVLVQGDTTTSLAAVLASYYRRIPAGHIEAGLRTGKAYEPFPEEINRRLVSHMVTWHFAPTALARSNLLREGISADAILVTGNTAVDTLLQTLRRLRRDTSVRPRWLPAKLLENRRLILVTGHRRESFGEGLRNICTAVRALADRHDDVVIVYPVHLNPAVQVPVRKILADHARILLTAPLEYVPFIELMRRAYLILTDSGGIQEEAPSLRIPVLVMRDTTERPEAAQAGAARLVGTNSDSIVAATERLLADRRAYQRMRAARNPYGDGHASEAIVRHLEAVLGS